ncbi:MAG: hypothetical protein NUV52_01200 [Candidatus Roizmanbacteria bacterium]|nr:hypothetical protein [Candidatus Roizmanbacteria bacterium]
MQHKALAYLALIGFGVYALSLFNGFVWDDFSQVVHNTEIHSLSRIPSLFLEGFGLYYKPVFYTLLSLIYALAGPYAPAYHILQLCLHIGNAFLIYILFARFFKKETSLILAIVFLVHPLNTETVSYIATLQDVLFLFFGMLSLLIWINYPVTSQRILLASFCSLISLLSKESGILFLGINLIAIFFLKKEQLKAYIVSSIITVSIYMLLRVTAIDSLMYSNSYANIPSDKRFTEIPHIMMFLPLSMRLLSMPKILAYYLGNAIYPNALSISQFWAVRTITLSDFIMPLAMVIFFFTVLFFIYIKGKNNKTFSRVYIIFFLWFIMGLAFHSQLIPLDATVADRWFYFPIIGLLGIIGAAIDLSKFGSFISRKKLFVVSVIVLIALGVKATLSSLNWKNNITLYSYGLSMAKDNYELENTLGVELTQAKRYSEAEQHIKHAITLRKDYWVTWHNLGFLYEEQKKFTQATECYQKAILYGDQQYSYENLARVLLFQNPKKAKTFAIKALIRFPTSHLLMYILAQIEYKLGNQEKALSLIEKAYALYPDVAYLNFKQKIEFQPQ